MPLTSEQRATLRTQQFRALADETRLQILESLRGGEQCVCELTEALELGQSLLSFHLKTLKEAGLVRDRREGRWVHYSLEPKSVVAMSDFLRELTAPVGVRSKNPRCCD